MKKTLIALIVLAGVGIATYYLVFNKAETDTTTDVIPTIEEDKPAEFVQPDTSNTATPSIEEVKPTDIIKPDSAPAKTETTVTPTPTITNVAVSIKNFAFSSSTLTVKSGTKVTWTNSDTAPHTVTSDSGNTLNSGNLSAGKSFSFTFTTEGTYTYHCAVHPSMKGTIIVKN